MVLLVVLVVVAVFAILWFSASGFMYFEIQDKPDLTWVDAFWWGEEGEA